MIGTQFLYRVCVSHPLGSIIPGQVDIPGKYSGSTLSDIPPGVFLILFKLGSQIAVTLEIAGDQLLSLGNVLPFQALLFSSFAQLFYFFHRYFTGTSYVTHLAPPANHAFTYIILDNGKSSKSCGRHIKLYL